MSKAILDQAVTPTRSRTFFEGLVLKSLSKMQEGFLQITLPSGERLVLGSPDAEVRASIRILRADFFRKCILYGDIGFGEAYVDGDWQTEDLKTLISWMILNVNANPAMSGSSRHFSLLNILQAANRLYHRLRPNTLQGSRRNIAAHYDLSNEFFGLFLDESMTYSSAYFKSADTPLDEAQREKYDRLCKFLKLKPTDHLLEIGTGWGGLALHAASTYGCKVTTVTVSMQQHAMATRRVKEAGLSGQVEVRLQDYRLIEGTFDKLVSIEMLEAVGHAHLETYFKKCQSLLKPEGLMALQVITCPDNRYDLLRKGVDWIQKHIFPGSLLPSVGAINRAVNKTGDMILHRLEDMGDHYAKTLSQWRKNFNTQRERVQSIGFDDAFIRKWNYYFSYCEAAFQMRNISVVQLVYTRPNNHRL